MTNRSKSYRQQHLSKRNRRARLFAGAMFGAFLLLHLVPAQSQPTSLEKEQTNPAAVQPKAVLLEPNISIERELTGGETHIYQINLAAGEFLRVTAEQGGIDVVLSLKNSDGRRLTEVDGFGGLLGAEELFWESLSGGSFQLEVRPQGKKAKISHYRLKAEKTAVLTARTKSVVTAQQLSFDARQRDTQGTGASLEQAVELYQKALTKWREAGEEKWEGVTLNDLGGVHRSLGKFESAREFYEQSLAIWRKLKDKRGEATALRNLGNIFVELEYYEQARTYYQQALAIAREINDKYGEGQTLNGLGVVHRNLGAYEEARKNYEEALAVNREIKDRIGEGAVLSNLGTVNWSLSEYEQARKNYEQALAVAREVKDRIGEGISLTNLGLVCQYLSEYEQAREFYEQSLIIWRDLKDKHKEGLTLNNLGTVYGDFKEFDRARTYYEESLQIMREVGDRSGEAQAINNLGDIYRNLGEFERARGHYRQALLLHREIKDRLNERATLVNLGIIYEYLNQTSQALENYEQALAIAREIKDRGGEGQTLYNIGNIYQNSSKNESAQSYYAQSLVISRAVRDRHQEAETLYQISRVEMKRGNFAAARSNIESALVIVESLRTSFASQDLRSIYFASIRNYYELYIELLMRLHQQQPSQNYDLAALEASERARARSLLDLLSEAQTDIRRGVDPGLLEKERTLRQQLNQKADIQTRLLTSKQSAEKLAAVEKEIAALTTEYERVQAQIRLQNPRYAALMQPQPLKAAEIQQLVDKDTLLLEYSLGKERSYLWAVSADSITSYELPREAVIEEQAKRVYQLLTARDAAVAGIESAEQRITRIRENETAYQQAAAQLSEVILAPVAEKMKNKRLAIISDGALQYVPFAALPTPDALANNDDKTIKLIKPPANQKSNYLKPENSVQMPLLAAHEVINLPSASVLAILRREQAKQLNFPKTVAVIADPVFEKTDARVRANSLSGKTNFNETKETSKTQKLPNSVYTSRQVTRAFKEAGAVRNGEQVPRLLFSRREAEAITAVSPNAHSLMLDFAANRAAVVNYDLNQYRIVHFATHGLLNSQNPELSGLVLSLVNERGEAQNGFLRMNDIFNLNLSAELVVLSACQTALGKEVRGEGLIGLTRGFMYAGSPRVVASLWKVDDRATAELMKRFYQAMLNEKMRPAAALQAAKMSMSRERQWQSPYYWAAFELHGEWR